MPRSEAEFPDRRRCFCQVFFRETSYLMPQSEAIIEVFILSGLFRGKCHKVRQYLKICSREVNLSGVFRETYYLIPQSEVITGSLYFVRTF